MEFVNFDRILIAIRFAKRLNIVVGRRVRDVLLDSTEPVWIRRRGPTHFCSDEKEESLALTSSVSVLI